MKNRFDYMEDGQGTGELVKAIYQKTSTLPSTHKPINLSTYKPINPSTHKPINPSTHQPINP